MPFVRLKTVLCRERTGHPAGGFGVLLGAQIGVTGTWEQPFAFLGHFQLLEVAVLEFDFC